MHKPPSILSYFLHIKHSSPKSSYQQSKNSIQTFSIRIWSVSRKLPEVPSTTLSWSVVLPSRKPSHTQVLSNNQRASRTLKLWSWKSNSNLSLKRKTQKLELKMLMISKVSLMLNGKSFTKSCKRLRTLVPISFCQSSQSVIWPPNGSLTEESSVLVEFQKMIWKELPRPLAPNFKQP